MSPQSFVLILCLLYLSLFSVHAISAPKAKSSQECEYVADMALTTRAMASEHVSPETMRAVLQKMYIAEVSQAWALALIPVALRDVRDPQSFAGEFLRHCIQNRGDTKGFFGTDI